MAAKSKDFLSTAKRRVGRKLKSLRELILKRTPTIIVATVARRTLLNTATIEPARSASITTSVVSEKAQNLRNYFRNDSYSTAKFSEILLHDCILDSESGLIITKENKLEKIAENIASYYVDTASEALIEKVRTSASSRVSNEVLHVFHRSCSAYGHFILDGLPPLALNESKIKDGGLKIALPAFMPSWSVAALEELGFDESHIVRLYGNTLFEKLHITNFLSSANCFLPHPLSISALKKLANAEQNTQGSRRIFLTRDGAYSPRFAENEDEVQKEFLCAGFEIVDPTKLSFREQINLFASASILAGNHGSAFVNMIFTPPKATIIDLMPEHWVDYWPGETGSPERWLLNLTAACGHDYRLILSESILEGEPFEKGDYKGLPTIRSVTDMNAVRSILNEL